MALENLEVHLSGENMHSGELCDVCDKTKEKAKVYCLACPKKLCATHEKVGHFISTTTTLYLSLS